MSHFDHISTFIQVVEAHGFAPAAKKLNISTAAVSRQVSQLEAHLGTQLLIRTTRHLALTEIGIQYYQECKTIIDALVETETNIAGSQKEASGLLRVMSNRYFAMSFIIPKLPIFLKQNPKLKVQLELAERLPDLLKENIDILFGVSLEVPPTLVRKKVATARYVLCASPAYLKKFGTPKTPADLLEHRYIAHSERRPADVISFADGKEYVLKPYLTLNDTFAMKECALHGMGIVRLHDYLVREDCKHKKLIEILTDFQFEASPVYLFYQQRRYLLPKIRKFIDFYVDKLPPRIQISD